MTPSKNHHAVALCPHRVGWMPSALAISAICARWRAIEAANSCAPPRLGVCAVALSLSSISLSSEAATTSAPMRSRKSAESALLPNRPTLPSISSAGKPASMPVGISGRHGGAENGAGEASDREEIGRVVRQLFVLIRMDDEAAARPPHEGVIVVGG